MCTGIGLRREKCHDCGMIPEAAFAKDASPAPYTMLHALLKKNGVKLVGDSKVQRFTEEGVEVIDKSWRTTLLKADTIVNALGMRTDKAMADKFTGLVPEVYMIGDASKVGNIRHATNSAFIYAVEC